MWSQGMFDCDRRSTAVVDCVGFMCSNDDVLSPEAQLQSCIGGRTILVLVI